MITTRQDGRVSEPTTIKERILPGSGQDLAFRADSGHYQFVHGGSYDDLVEHIARSTSLTRGEAARVVAEVLVFLAEPLPDFVRRRHAELKYGGLRNDQIFAMIGDELVTRRVAPPRLTPRQLRRIVYG